MERKPAVAVVFHHIGPYHHARLNAAVDRLSVTGIEWLARADDAWAQGIPLRAITKFLSFSEATPYPEKTELRRDSSLLSLSSEGLTLPFLQSTRH